MHKNKESKEYHGANEDSNRSRRVEGTRRTRDSRDTDIFRSYGKPERHSYTQHQETRE